MLTLKKLAVTGGLSCGKSLVCRYLRELGAYVVDSDRIVHQLLTPDTDLGKKVIELLGSGVVVDNAFDRARVARKVFLNPKLLRSLENILHPPVYEEIERQYHELNNKRDAATLFVAEIPLLFETGGERYFDKTIAVVADRESCWDRYRKQTGYEREDFNRRMVRQLRQREKAEKADHIIYNNGSEAELRQEVNKLYRSLAKE